METTNNDYVNNLYKHQEQSRELKHYSLKRVDIMVISISGAGIYLLFEMLKFFLENKMNEDTFWIKVCGLFFALSIIINFVSQWTGYYSNTYEEEWSSLEIEQQTEKDKSNEARKSILDNRVNRYNWWTTALNIFSTGLMVIGVIILMVYCAAIF